jgi:hypothetical protein
VLAEWQELYSLENVQAMTYSDTTGVDSFFDVSRVGVFGLTSVIAFPQSDLGILCSDLINKLIIPA